MKIIYQGCSTRSSLHNPHTLRIVVQFIFCNRPNFTHLYHMRQLTNCSTKTARRCQRAQVLIGVNLLTSTALAISRLMSVGVRFVEIASNTRHVSTVKYRGKRRGEFCEEIVDVIMDRPRRDCLLSDQSVCLTLIYGSSPRYQLALFHGCYIISRSQPAALSSILAHISRCTKSV